jgi:hypothetical protein
MTQWPESEMLHDLLADLNEGRVCKRASGAPNPLYFQQNNFRTGNAYLLKSRICNRGS